MSPQTERTTVSRRAVLASGVAALLAGCSGGDGSTGSEPTPTDAGPGTTPTATAQTPGATATVGTPTTTTTGETPTATPTPTTTPVGTSTPDAPLGSTLTVGDRTVATRPELVARRSVLVDDEPVVVNASAGRQFVFAGVDVVDGTPPPRQGFALRVGTDTVVPQVTFQGQVPRGFALPGDYPYDPPSGLTEGWLGFELPAPVPSDAQLALTLAAGGETGRWTVPESGGADAKAQPAAFEFVQTTLPGSVSPGTAFDIRVTIRNVGDGSGQALVAVLESLDGAYVGRTATAVVVGPDSEVSIPVNIGLLLDRDSGDQVRLGIRTSGGNRDVRIDVESE